MAEFKRGGNRSSFSRGSRSGGFGNRGGGFGGRNRDFGSGERRRVEMHDAVCDQCGKQCQVPFKPTGDKPVFCSDCFRKNEGSNGNSGSMNQRPVQSGVSLEQLNQINAKLDKILKFIQNLEVEVDNEDLVEDDEDGEDAVLEKDEDLEKVGEDEDDENS